MSTRAKRAALEALIEAHATELKLPTVKLRFRALAAGATREQQTPVAYLACLLEAEHQERSGRRERPRLIDARFPLIKRVEEFRFEDNAKVPQATIATLAEGSWLAPGPVRPSLRAAPWRSCRRALNSTPRVPAA